VPDQNISHVAEEKNKGEEKIEGNEGQSWDKKPLQLEFGRIAEREEKMGGGKIWRFLVGTGKVAITGGFVGKAETFG